jgi:hypothetical protein
MGMRRIVAHVRGNVVGYLALFVALSSGAYGAVRLPVNSVGPKQLRSGAVVSSKIAPNAVTGAKVAANSLTGADINEATLGTVPNATDATELGGAGASAYVKSTDAIPAGDLTGTYGAPTIAAGAVTGSMVAANSLTGASIDESTLSGIGAGVMTGRLDTLSPSIINGGPPVGTSTGTSATVSTYQTVSPSVGLVARDFTFRLSAAPGAGTSRDMEFVVGSGATVMCTISGSATSCTAPGPVSLPASTSFSVQTEPHNSPAAADLSFGYVLTTP